MTFKLYFDHWDIDADLGVGKLWNDSNSQGGRYESNQTDNIFYGSTHLDLRARRERGEPLFPKTVVDLEVIWPYSTHHHHTWEGERLKPDPFNNHRAEVSLEQGIYDFQLNHIRFTPGIKVGYVKEYDNNLNSTFFGPSVTLSCRVDDLASFALLFKNPDDHNDQWLTTLFVNIGEVYSYLVKDKYCGL